MVGFAEIGLVVGRQAGTGFALDDARGEATAAAATWTDKLFEGAFVVLPVEGLDAGCYIVVLLMVGFDELLVLAWAVEAQGLVGLRIMERLRVML